MCSLRSFFIPVVADEYLLCFNNVLEDDNATGQRILTFYWTKSNAMVWYNVELPTKINMDTVRAAHFHDGLVYLFPASIHGEPSHIYSLNPLPPNYEYEEDYPIQLIRIDVEGTGPVEYTQRPE